MIYTAEWLLPISSEPIEHGQMLVKDGGILAVGRGIDRQYPGEPVKEFPDCALLPGFVNCHTHLELTGLRGRLDGLPFFQWLRAHGAEGRVQTPEFFEQGARAACGELLASGTTTVSDISSHGVSHKAIKELGIRAAVFFEIIAFGPDEHTLPSVREMFDLLPTNTPLVEHSISVHSLFSVSPAAMDLAVTLAKERKLRLAVHAAESLAEAEFMRGRGEIAGYHREIGLEWRVPEVSPVEYLKARGVLSPSTTAVHCAHVSNDDLDILASTGTAVAHCPRSNARLGHGIAPVAKMIRSGIAVGLGTDSAVSNERLDMFEEMRSAVLFARARDCDPCALSVVEALKMATLGGAEALGLADRVGSLEPGKRADFIAVDLGEHPENAIPLSPPFSRGDERSLAAAAVPDPIAHIVYRRGPEHVRLVAVEGRTLFSKGPSGSSSEDAA